MYLYQQYECSHTKSAKTKIVLSFTTPQACLHYKKPVTSIHTQLPHCTTESHNPGTIFGQNVCHTPGNHLHKEAQFFRPQDFCCKNLKHLQSPQMRSTDSDEPAEQRVRLSLYCASDHSLVGSFNLQGSHAKLPQPTNPTLNFGHPHDCCYAYFYLN